MTALSRNRSEDMLTLQEPQAPGVYPRHRHPVPYHVAGGVKHRAVAAYGHGRVRVLKFAESFINAQF